MPKLVRATRRALMTAAFGLAIAGCGKIAEVDLDDGRPGDGPGGWPSQTMPDSTGNASNANDANDAKSSSSGSVSSGGRVIHEGEPRKRTDLALQSLSETTCRNAEQCGLSASAVFTWKWGDQPGCVAGKADALATTFALDGITVTQAQIDACAARQALAPCETDIIECQFKGTLAAGATCETNAQCASGECKIDSSTLCGQCVDRVPAGGDCTTERCDAGLTCNEVTRKCVSPLPGGASCKAEEELCGPGLACLGGLCTNRLPVGAKCSGAGRGVHFGYYDDCEGGSWCHSQTLVCTPFRKVTASAGLGESCGGGIACRASTCDDDTRTCVPHQPLPAPSCP